MNELSTISLLSDFELDLVGGGRHQQNSSGGTTTIVEIVEISVGQVAAVGNSTVNFNITGIGNSSLSPAQLHGHHH